MKKKKSVKKAKKVCKKKCANKCSREKAYGDPNPVVPVCQINKPPSATEESLWSKIKKLLGL